MPGMQHGSAHNQRITFIDEILDHATAGTSAQPNSTDEPMIMRIRWQMDVYVSWRGISKRLTAKRPARL